MTGNERIRILDLMGKRAALTKEIVALFNKAHPVGSRVFFQKWGGDIAAEVIRHDLCWEHIMVRTDKGKKYWVDFSWFLT